jgi:hypothetical protein
MRYLQMPSNVNPKGPKAIGPAKSTSAKVVKAGFKSAESWSKKSSGKWKGGQARTLSPGSTGAITKRLSSNKYKALGKKVIRPRIRKQFRPKEK